MKIRFYWRKIRLKSCKYADLVDINALGFMRYIVVEKQQLLVYTQHKYRIDFCAPKSKASFVFIYLEGKA